MYLIALRERINIDLDNYINLIRKEYKLNTMLEDDNSILIKRCRVPMREEDIEKGIKLGKTLLKKK